MFAFSYQGILSSYLDLELLKGRARLLHLWVPLGTAVMGTDCLPYPLPALLTLCGNQNRQALLIKKFFDPFSAFSLSHVLQFYLTKDTSLRADGVVMP